MEIAMKTYLAVGALLALATPASAQNLFTPLFGGADTPETTMQFRAEALRSDAYEIEASRVALERSRSPRVRAFARQMIADHTATTNALLPPGASLNAAGNVVSEKEAGVFDNGPLGILVAPLSVPVNLVGDVFGPGANEGGHRVALDPRRAAMLGELNTARGQRGFNATYTKQQVKAHQEAVALYANEAQNGDLDEARTFASQALPALQGHLNHAVALDERVGDPSAPAF
jgi:predicted outer membrane protein